MRSATRRALYPFRASTLKKLEEEIDYTMSELSTILQLFQHVDTRNIQEDLTKVHELLRVMRADNVSENARTWLNAPDTTVNYNFACKKRQPGTGSWFVESEQYKQWLDMPKKALWLRGFAGCGKSVLSSTIIQNTILSRGSEPDVGIAFFYFTFTDQGKQDAGSMLKSLILQLASQARTDCGVLQAFYEQHKGSSPSDDLLRQCLSDLTAEFKHVYIMLDALDESPLEPHRPDPLDMIIDLANDETAPIHLLMTSRPDPDITQAVAAFKHEEIVLKNASIDADIALFVSEQLQSNGDCTSGGTTRQRLSRCLRQRHRECKCDVFRG